MKTLLRWARNLIVAVAALLLAGAGILWAMSERILRRQWDASGIAVAVPTDPAAIERGRRLAVTRGCAGCHRDRLQGGVFLDVKHVARLVAPNLARLAREVPVEQLERSIRQGVREDGATVRGMPSETFYALTDEDLGALIAYLRSVEPATDPLPETEIRVFGRLGLALGKYKLAPQYIAEAKPQRVEPVPGDPVAQGRYLAHTICVECHGLDLHGDASGDKATPHLAVVASYTPEEFRRLMATGEPAGTNKLTLMAAVAKERFAHLAPEEVDALYQYLGLLADPSAAGRL